jgi:hypothetical protein
MSTIDKQGIREKLINSIDHEELPNREAARLLNIHPCYISMVKNEKSWDGITSKIWARFDEWYQGRDLLKNFVIPEGEEIYKQKEKEVKTSGQFIAGIDDPMAKLLSGGFRKDKNTSTEKPVFTNLNEKEREVKKEGKALIKKISNQAKDIHMTFTKSDIDLLIKRNEVMQVIIDDFIAEKSDKSDNKTSFIPDGIRQKLMLDIEINLTINGHSIKI